MNVERKSSAKILLTAGLLIAGAIVISAMAGKTGISEAKVTGWILAVVAFLPVFMILVKKMRSGSPNEVLGVFIGGFFFKLFILGAGIWWGIKVAGFPMIEFSASCLAFLVAFQIIESLYFAGR